jgi:hypothetical protein
VAAIDTRSYRERRAPKPTPDEVVEATRLIVHGYRRTSWKHRQVSRIDRPDWVTVLARSLRRAPADFYVPGEDTPAGNWADHYRRVHSRDHLTVSAAVVALVPASTWDNVGYVEVMNDETRNVSGDADPTEGEGENRDAPASA